MSPHGSKFFELIRYVANRFLTDSQRKKIKNTLTKLQRIPLKLLGIEALVMSLKSEIERLKSRVILLDGKLNIALYGMPKIDEKYRASLISNEILINDFSNDSLIDHLKNQSSKKQSKAALLGLKELHSKFASVCEAVETGIFFGLGQPESVIQSGKIFSNIKKKFYCDFDTSQYKDIENLGSEILETHPITALIALSDIRLDLIFCCLTFERFSPLEQLKFLQLSYDRLSDNGVLCFILPQFSDSKLVQDLFWSDPKVLRPYSKVLIEDSLKYLGGKFEWVDFNQNLKMIFFLKESNSECQNLRD